MELSYDPKFNIAYLRFRPKTKEVESIKISDEIIVDISPDGVVYGIELLNANEQLKREGDTLSIINEATGEKRNISLSL
jgi:uncharacterized protein YuzE